MFLTYLFARNKYAIFTVILLTMSLFGGIYLVNQRHDLRQLATDDSGSGQWDECKLWSGGNYSELNNPSSSYPDGTNWFDAHNSTDIIKKIHYTGTVSLRWQSVFRCDYQKLMEKDGNVNECTTGDEDTWPSSNSKPHHSAAAIYTTGYSPNLGELIDWSHDNGQCQVIQVDVGGCPGGDINARYVVYVNDVCPTLTPTPTPTPSPPIKQCNDACSNDSECSTGYCYFVDMWARERCRNRDCQLETDCICPGITPTNTPPLTPTPPPTNTPTLTPTLTPTNTPTLTPTPTGTLTPTLTPTPTLPTDIYCLYCHAYDKDWQQITNLDNLTIGEEIYFATMGSGQTTKGRFRVTVDGESGDWHESTQQNNNDEFYLLHTVQQFGTHHVKCEVYDPSSGWK